jgi:hypothetical protein
MLKFKGNAKDFRAYMDNLIETYGSKTTIKEICEMIGALKNVSL